MTCISWVEKTLQQQQNLRQRFCIRMRSICEKIATTINHVLFYTWIWTLEDFVFVYFNLILFDKFKTHIQKTS